MLFRSALGGGGLFAWDWVVRGHGGESFQKPLMQSVNRSTSAEAPPLLSPSADVAAAPARPSYDELAARLADLETRLSQVPLPPSQPAPPGAADAQIAQLQARIASLETSIAAEKTRADRAEQATRVVTERWQASLRTATALARLRTNLERGYPFEHEIEEASAAFAGNADAVARLQPLRQWAESGIATRADLRTTLETLGSDIARAALLEGAETFWQAIVARVRSLVIVRPTPDGDIPPPGTEEGDKPGAVVARGEARLRNDDVAGAIAELSALTGSAADVARAWVAAARARVTADQTIAALDDALHNSAPMAPRMSAPGQVPSPDRPGGGQVVPSDPAPDNDSSTGETP